MKNPDTLIDSQDHIEIQNALRAAEARTSGEIVPVIAQASGRYDRAEDLFGIVFAGVVLALGWLIAANVGTTQALWSGEKTQPLGLLAILFILAIGFVIGSWIATKVPALRMPLTTAKEKNEEVERRAAECFHRFGVGQTAGATGVLIYVSLEERLVRVEGDAAINEKLNSTDWTTVCDLITTGIKNDGLTTGLNAGIAKVGELLTGHFPREENDANELPDTVHIIAAR